MGAAFRRKEMPGNVEWSRRILRSNRCATAGFFVCAGCCGRVGITFSSRSRRFSIRNRRWILRCGYSSGYLSPDSVTCLGSRVLLKAATSARIALACSESPEIWYWRASSFVGWPRRAPRPIRRSATRRNNRPASEVMWPAVNSATSSRRRTLEKETGGVIRCVTCGFSAGCGVSEPRRRIGVESSCTAHPFTACPTDPTRKLIHSRPPCGRKSCGPRANWPRRTMRRWKWKRRKWCRLSLRERFFALKRCGKAIEGRIRSRT